MKKKINFKFIVAIISALTILFFYRLLFYYPDITIRVAGLYKDYYGGRARVICADNEYYTMINGDIRNISDNKIIHRTSDENAFIKSQCGLLWVFDNDSRNNLIAFDSKGNIVKSFSVSQHITDFFISGDMIFCELFKENSQSSSIRLYQISDDDNINLVPINYSLIYETESPGFKLYKYECDYGGCLYFDYGSDNYYDSYFAYDLNYNNLIKSKTLSYDLLHVEKDEAIYADIRSSVKDYTEYSFENNTINEYELDIENSFDGFFPNMAFYSDENTIISVAQSVTHNRIIGRHPPVSYSDEMQFHLNDMLYIFDTDNFSNPVRFKTKTFERIIYADKEIAITYYNGKYITYSLENWKKIGRQKADEIEKGGSYSFESCGDYIFVFDDNTGEMINKIVIQ